MRINNNIGAINAWRQLTRNESSFDKSLERLSSGYRINSAGDDPAGLVLSEQLRSQIGGLKQAVRNTQDAASMVQTAEGSMQEMASILNEVKALILHAKNTGVVDSTAIAADQAQVDEAIAALDKIANNTYFGGKNLLNGSTGNRATVVNSTAIASVSVGSTAASGTNLLNVVVSSAATRATSAGSVNVSGGTASAGTLVVNGYSIALTDTATQAATIAELNTGFASNGLDLTAVANGNSIDIRHNQYGADYSVTVNDASGLLRAAGFNSAVGTNVAGTINGEAATGSGLTLTANSGTSYAGLAATFTTAGNTATTYTSALSVTQGSLSFQVGDTASDVVSASIQDVRAAMLGVTAGGSTGLNSIKSGGAYALATDPSTALDVIDEAIDDVSTARSQLGAIQKYTLDTKINSLNVSIENVTAAESRLRDVDMASEMANFTKNQILVQSATAMLAQANAAPQNVLTLIRS